MKLRLVDLMKAWNKDKPKAERMSWYRLAAASGLSLATIYTLKNARPVGHFERLEARTIDGLCRALDTTPGELIEYKKGA